MKKINFPNYRLLTAALIAILILPLISCTEQSVEQMYYEIKVYSVTQPAQAESVDRYLSEAFIPALHRAGISKVGVFKPIEADTAVFGKLIFVFIPYVTANHYLNLPGVLAQDPDYEQAGKGKAFLDAPYDNPPFDRYESILLKAFKNMPQFRVPSFTTPAAERIYELRSYESATDAKAAKKREMFNQGGEIAIFDKLGFNAVFYGEVLAGSHMPNLMYMTTFADMKSHNELWVKFRTDPDWIKLSGLEEYKNTVSKSNRFLLHPTSYSDF
jgi:hypothetical protein